MNYIGIDISKYKHDCFIMTDLGEVINEGSSFTNNAEGFVMLQRELEPCKEGGVQIGFESTGNYGINLKLFLEKIGYDYMEVNPLLIKEYIKSQTLRRTKPISWMPRLSPVICLKRDINQTRHRFIRNLL